MKLNAEEQLLRAKGQVARLQSGPTPNQSLSKEVQTSSRSVLCCMHEGRAQPVYDLAAALLEASIGSSRGQPDRGFPQL